jgi:hypothetical protein
MFLVIFQINSCLCREGFRHIPNVCEFSLSTVPHHGIFHVGTKRQESLQVSYHYFKLNKVTFKQQPSVVTVGVASSSRKPNESDPFESMGVARSSHTSTATETNCRIELLAVVIQWLYNYVKDIKDP